MFYLTFPLLCPSSRWRAFSLKVWWRNWFIVYVTDEEQHLQHTCSKNFEQKKKHEEKEAWSSKCQCSLIFLDFKSQTTEHHNTIMILTNCTFVQQLVRHTSSRATVVYNTNKRTLCYRFVKKKQTSVQSTRQLEAAGDSLAVTFLHTSPGRIRGQWSHLHKLIITCYCLCVTENSN